MALRPTRVDDWDALYAIASDPLLWAGHPAWDRHEELVFRAYFETNLASGGCLTICDCADGSVRGASRYSNLDVAQRAIEIGGTYIARAHWGGPTNRETKRLLIAHALATLNRVSFQIGAANIRSRRAIEKIGARLTDRTVFAEMAGASVEHVFYEIDRRDFANGPLSAAA